MPENESDSESGPKWPVEDPSELTPDHVPEDVRAELVGPYRDAADCLAAFASQVMNRRNDLVQRLSAVQREADKDSTALNQALASDRLRNAFVLCGNTVPTREHADGQEEQ